MDRGAARTRGMKATWRPPTRSRARHGANSGISGGHWARLDQPLGASRPAIRRVSTGHWARLDRPFGASQRWLDGRVAIEVGDRVRVEMEKWGGRPHWRFDATW